jgi:hypothetical protein
MRDLYNASHKLSPKSHRAMSRVCSSFKPARRGDAASQSAKPGDESSAVIGLGDLMPFSQALKKQDDCHRYE